jgi:hypothetical protein
MARTNNERNPAVIGVGLYIEPREITDSWAIIAERTKADTAKYYYRVGDYKTITLSTGETVVMEIAGINTYKGYGDVVVGPHIDWISRDCMATVYQYNSTATNNGTKSEPNPWRASDLYNTLNTTVYSTLPTDLQTVIAEKRMRIEQRYSSSGSATTGTGLEWNSVGKLWLPTEVEMTGCVYWGAPMYSVGSVQYPLNAQGTANHTNKSRKNWWLMNAIVDDSERFCGFNVGGSIGYFKATSKYCAPLCFRVG